MSAPLKNTQIPGWYRFLVGDFECTVVWDGYIHHAYDGLYPNSDPAELQRLRSKYLLPDDHIPMDLNPVLVNTGEKLFLIDAGMGRSSTVFGDTMGKMLENMKAAGFSADDVDVVLMTHMHPDHSYGLVNPDGSALFKNAEICVTNDDWSEWTDDESAERNDWRGDWTRGTIESVAPYDDRIKLIEPGSSPYAGMSTMSTAGHSSGQCAFIFESRGEKVMFTGDLAHHHIYDTYHPEWYFHNDYDTNPPQGAVAKSEAFTRAVDEDIRVHGYHFPYPGIGVLTRVEDGTFRFHGDVLTPRMGAGRFGTG